VTRSRVLLFVLHLVGNALLLWLGYAWLGMGESDRVHLVTSLLTFLLFVSGAAWLHGSSFAFFSGLPLGAAFRRAARHLLPLLVLSLVAWGIYAVTAVISEHWGYSAYALGSFSTMATKRPVSPSLVQRIFEILLLVVRWILLPALLLPLASALATRGWKGLKQESWRKRARSILYWVEIAFLAAVAIWLPFKLFFWVPTFAAFGLQMVSFILRFGASYLLFVAGLLALEFFTSSGNPRETQPSTLVSP
jgi:hypothetical protein